MELDATIVYGAGTAMASAIVTQWIWFTSQFKTVEAKLAKCEADHDSKDKQITKLWARITSLSTRLAMVSTCHVMDCPVRKVVTSLAVITLPDIPGDDSPSTLDKPKA